MFRGCMQTESYNPDNFSIQNAQKQDYQEFYETEIALRKQLKYPPFCDIIIIGFNSINEEEIKKASNLAYEIATNNLNQEEFKVFKPMPSPIDKIQNKYRWRMIIKGKMTAKAYTDINDCLSSVYSKNIKNTKVWADINPNSMI